MDRCYMCCTQIIPSYQFLVYSWFRNFRAEIMRAAGVFDILLLLAFLSLAP